LLVCCALAEICTSPAVHASAFINHTVGLLKSQQDTAPSPPAESSQRLQAFWAAITKESTAGPPASASSLASLLPGLKEDGLICGIAREISDEILSANPGEANATTLLNELQNVSLSDPSQILQALSGSGTSSGAIGDVVRRVSSKIHAKLASGQIGQQQLMEEALGLLASSGGGLGGLLGSLGGVAATHPPAVVRSATARARLRAKLEARRQQRPTK
jgi:hypothetical protein